MGWVRNPRLLMLMAVVALLGGCISDGGDVRAPVFEGAKGERAAGAAMDSTVEKTRSAPSTVATARYYVVKPGDTLYSIAWRENVDYRDLAAWNRLPADFTIHPGQQLRLGAPPQGAAMAPVYATTAQPADSPSAPLATRQNDPALASKSSAVSSKKSSTPSRPSGGRQLNWRKPSDGPVVRGFVDGDLTRKGVQFGGKEGDPVLAAESGKVVYSGTGLIGYGRLIIVKHDDNYLSAYGNNRSILVKEGQSVSAGERIAEMGRSDQGKAYLYFEIRQQGKPVDPIPLLPR